MPNGACSALALARRLPHLADAALEFQLRVLVMVMLVVAAAALAALGAQFQGLPDARGALALAFAPRAAEPPAAVSTEASEPAAPSPIQPAAVAVAIPAVDMRALVENRLRAAPDHASYFRRLKDAFPSEYAVLIDGLTAPALAKKTLPDPDAALIASIRRLRQTHGVLAARAGLAALEKIPRAQNAIMQALQDGDPHLCADFFYGGSADGFVAFANRNPHLVTDLARANLEAVVEGAGSTVAAPEPSDDDVTALEAALAAHGLSPTEIALLLDDKTPDPPIDDARLCRAGVAYLETLLSLPVGSRWSLLARSAALAARS